MDYKSREFKSWLNKLQQESWQLELIVSGFALYGLFQLFKPLNQIQINSENQGQFWVPFVLDIVESCVEILCFALVLHVFLRGLWIGAIGLRYVSGEIDYDNLKYSPKFTSFLKKKVGSFDRFIFRLENVCSTLFALAFLLVFYLISFFALFLIFVGVAFFVVEYTELIADTKIFRRFVLSFFFLFLILCGILFIDFLGMGILKKNRFVSKIYFPIYRVFGFLTLSFLYRPLIYNFLDQRKARWVVMAILPLYLTTQFVRGFLDGVQSEYFKEQNISAPYVSHNKNYMQFLTTEDRLKANAIIPSQVIDQNYLEVFLPFKSDIQEMVYAKDSTLLHGQDSLTVQMHYNYIRALNQVYSVKIDSLFYPSDFVSSTNELDHFGFMNVLNIENLSKGKHVLYLIGPKSDLRNYLTVNNKVVTTVKYNIDFSKKDTLSTIPFWYYPNIGNGQQVVTENKNLPTQSE